jgi:hypothetical protein
MVLSRVGVLNRRGGADMNGADIVSIRQWKDAGDDSVQALVEKDIKQKGGKNAPL